MHTKPDKTEQEFWTEAEFQRVVLDGRKMAARTEEACRQVLVEGMPSREAAIQQQLFQAAVSRSVTVLRDRKLEMDRLAPQQLQGNAMLKFIALEAARGVMGAKLDVTDAIPGKAYEGPVVVSKHGFAVQIVGRSGVMHDLRNLDKVPELNQALSITYSPGQNIAVVGALTQSVQRDQGQGVGR